MADDTFIGKNGNALIPWKKGQSGNPKGKPKGAKTRSTILKMWMDAKMKGTADPFGTMKGELTIEQALELRAIQRALGITKGVKPETQHKAFVEIKDTLYGKKPEILTGDAENPLEHGITVRFID